MTNLQRMSLRSLFRPVGLAVLLACLLWPWGAGRAARPDEKPVLVFSTFESRGMGRLFERILREAYGRLGYALRFVEVPAERALVMSNQGLVDGEAGRVPVIESQYPHLVRVPTPLYHNRVVAFTREGGVVLPDSTWKALAPYRLGSVLGYKYVERKTAAMNRVVVSDYAKLFNMLRNDRVDVAVVEYLDALPSLHPRDRWMFRFTEPPLASEPMYHYLNRRHADLVPRIDGVLRDMVSEGRLAAILRETEAELTGK